MITFCLFLTVPSALARRSTVIKSKALKKTSIGGGDGREGEGCSKFFVPTIDSFLWLLITSEVVHEKLRTRQRVETSMGSGI